MTIATPKVCTHKIENINPQSCDIRHTHKIPPHTHRNEHPPIGATLSPRTLSPPATLATRRPDVVRYRSSVKPYPFGGVGRSSPPANTITPPPPPALCAPAPARTPARATGGLPSYTHGIHIYYPSFRCVVFSVHCGWWFGVFCDCGWSLTGDRVSPPRFTHVCVGSRSSFGGHLSQCSFER